ncbi:MAG: glycosyltransferase family 2 protein [Gemmatimonadota bacterium]
MRSEPLLSIVIPIFNEERTLPELYRRLRETRRHLPGEAEILFVNDGSTDASLELLQGFRGRDETVRIVDLSRNFGHQAALSAGLEYARGQAVVLMDGDLQDAPELLPELVKRWEEGWEVVYVVREGRRENALRRLAVSTFYRVLSAVSSVPLPLDAGIFSLLDRKVVEVLRSVPERSRYLSGLRAWSGFRQIGIPIERDARYAGKPRQSARKLLRLAADALFSFSYAPLRVATAVGAVTALGSFLLGGTVVALRLFTDLAIPGWSSILATITFLGGVQLLGLGILGEYIGRIYDEVKERPLYVVRATYGLADLRTPRVKEVI